MRTSQNVVNNKLYGYHEDTAGHENERALQRRARYSEPQEDTAQDPVESQMQQPNANEYAPNELQQMLMMLQAQQIIANSGSVNAQQQHPDLNNLVASQASNQMTQDAQRFVSHPESKTPDDIKLATQKQLADL